MIHRIENVNFKIFAFVQTSCKLRAKLRATLLKKNESEQRITHSLERSVTLRFIVDKGYSSTSSISSSTEIVLFNKIVTSYF